VFAEVPRLAGSYSPPSSGSPVVRGARALRTAGPEGRTKASSVGGGRERREGVDEEESEGYRGEEGAREEYNNA
jgi:hypothetical protein